jgi:hypothetical protein
MSRNASEGPNDQARSSQVALTKVKIIEEGTEFTMFKANLIL